MDNKNVEDRLEKLIDHAREAMKRFEPIPGNETADRQAYGANVSRRGGLEDALKVVRGEEDSIGDAIK